MARFVSRYGAYFHGVRTESSEQFSRGSRIIEKGLGAQFSPDGLTDEDVEFALAHLSFHGLPEDNDTGALISGRSRLSVFDSVQYKKENKLTDEEHDLVVETLLESNRLGLDYIEIVPVPAKVPWNGYDNIDDAEKIVDLMIATETSPELVLAYERENQNRPEVIEALENVENPEVEEAVVIDAGS